jgi:hypothetical protein
VRRVVIASHMSVSTPDMLNDFGYLINKAAIRDLELGMCDAPEHTVAATGAIKTGLMGATDSRAVSSSRGTSRAPAIAASSRRRSTPQAGRSRDQ